MTIVEKINWMNQKVGEDIYLISSNRWYGNYGLIDLDINGDTSRNDLDAAYEAIKSGQVITIDADPNKGIICDFKIAYLGRKPKLIKDGDRYLFYTGRVSKDGKGKEIFCVQPSNGNHYYVAHWYWEFPEEPKSLYPEDLEVDDNSYKYLYNENIGYGYLGKDLEKFFNELKDFTSLSQLAKEILEKLIKECQYLPYQYIWGIWISEYVTVDKGFCPGVHNCGKRYEDTMGTHESWVEYLNSICYLYSDESRYFEISMRYFDEDEHRQYLVK